MKDFPRSLQEFDQQFATDQACRDYLFRLRGSQGVCLSPMFGLSVLAGEVRVPGVRQMWPPDLGDSGDDLPGHPQTADRLVSRDVLGYDSEERGERTGRTARTRTEGLQDRPDLAAQVASCDGSAGNGPADGRVEVDEIFTAVVDEGARGHHAGRKALTIIAPQEDGPGIGRIRMCGIPDVSAESLLPFMKEAIETSSTVNTDGWVGYVALEVASYDHEVTFVSGKKKIASELMPRVHRVASLLKRWLMGTHPGAATQEHGRLHFRFNRRRSANRGEVFLSLAAAGCRHQSGPCRGHLIQAYIYVGLFSLMPVAAVWIFRLIISRVDQ